MRHEERIPSRKRDHVDLVLTREVGFAGKTNGLELWEFEHNALPELDLSDVDPSVEFLGRRLSFPLLITGMTGGYADAERWNAMLAEACQEERIALGVGSQRQALESDRFGESWRVARRLAPDVPILANIGAAEVARPDVRARLPALVESLGADALAVHCNPLQEFLQPEGDPRFRGVLDGIAELVRTLAVPVCAKEVGAGISASVARRLFDAGVRFVDVSGAGGTSWARIETMRRGDADEISPAFRDWGIPTADAIRAVARIAPADATLIASGGIADGVAIAVAIALGAHLAGAARPMLLALRDGGSAALLRRIRGWKNDLRGVMCLAGAPGIPQLRSTAVHRRTHP
jgi:isopentenyl-diphosphate delta-isomerase